jgi:uncharacterized protein (UPF0147 family)
MPSKNDGCPTNKEAGRHMRKDLKKAGEHIKNSVDSLQKVQGDESTPPPIRAKVSEAMEKLESMLDDIEEIRSMHVY